MLEAAPGVVSYVGINATARFGLPDFTEKAVPAIVKIGIGSLVTTKGILTASDIEISLVVKEVLHGMGSRIYSWRFLMGMRRGSILSMDMARKMVLQMEKMNMQIFVLPMKILMLIGPTKESRKYMIRGDQGCQLTR